jgi:AsmA protein
MKKAIKWIAVIGGALIVVIIALLLIVPIFVNLEKYKPVIEKQVTETTGRPFSIGGDLRLSLFPWAGLTLSDLHLGNPPGFGGKEFLNVKSFDVRAKLIPLLFRELEVKRFVIDGLKVVLERNKQGRGNWEGMGKPSEGAPLEPAKKRTKEKEPQKALPIEALTVGEFTVTNSSILLIDDATERKREVSQVTLRLKDVSLDRPIRLAFSAAVWGNPLSVEGQLGPLGKDPGKGKIPFDLAAKAFKEVDLHLKGSLIEPADSRRFDLAFEVSPFSPRKLMSAIGQPFPVATADPQVLSRLALKGKVKGDPQSLAVSDGDLELDESRLDFALNARDLSRPDVSFDVRLDRINLDRYLPAPAERKGSGEGKQVEPKKTDYAPLRKLVLAGSVQVGSFTVKKAKLENLHLKVSGKNGVFRLDPVTAKLYQGTLSSKASLDVSQDIPKTSVSLQAKGVQGGPLVKDLTAKDFIEGVGDIDAVIGMAGAGPDTIKRSLNGKGEFLLRDGAIKGIDLAGMVRNVKAAFGLAQAGERPRTDFSELISPFTIADGIVTTRQTALTSPLVRLLAAGEANLVDETLDFRVEPRFVATLKGQGDTQERKGIAVPLLVRGTFSSPTFQPDLKGMVEKGLTEGLLPTLEKKKAGDTKGDGTQQPAPSKTLKDIWKGLKGGQ